MCTNADAQTPHLIFLGLGAPASVALEQLGDTELRWTRGTKVCVTHVVGVDSAHPE